LRISFHEKLILLAPRVDVQAHHEGVDEAQEQGNHAGLRLAPRDLDQTARHRGGCRVTTVRDAFY